MSAVATSFNAAGGQSAVLDRGAAKLAYVRRPPMKQSRQPGVMYLPGLQSNKNGTKAVALEQVVERRLGCGFLRFDYAGHGESSPGPEQFADTHAGMWLDDARAALDKLTDGPQIVVGSSVGGLLAMHLAVERPDKVAGLVLVAPALGFDDRLWALLDASQQRVMLGGGKTTVPPGFIDCDTAIHNPSDLKIQFFREARKLVLPTTKPQNIIPVKCPVRILHGLRDKVVPVESSQRLIRRLESPSVSLTVLRDADHRLSNPDELEMLSATLLQLWEQVRR